MLDLSPIKERLADATPGPWTLMDYGDDHEVLVIHRDSENRICFMATPGSHGDPAQIRADAELIVNAPTDIAALVAEVERLRADNARLLADVQALEATEP